MKKLYFLIALVAVVAVGCKDGTAPTFSSLTINGVAANVGGTEYTGSVGETVTMDWIVADDTELFEFITFIDTTGFEDRERLHAQSISGKEDFVRVELRMKALDSLSQLYYFGNPIPVNFTIIDDGQNKTNTQIIFTAE